MTHDEGAGEHPFQFAQQRFQGYFLRHGARVPRMAFAVQSPFVADADAVAVVVQAVRPYPLQRTAVVYHPVARDVEVVADVTEAAVADVIRAALFKIKALPLAGGRAMKDNQRDGSHRPTQDEMPNTPARAVATATIALSTMLHTDFLVVVVVAITLYFLLLNDVLSDFSAADNTDDADLFFIQTRRHKDTEIFSLLSCRACRDISHNAEYALREPLDYARGDRAKPI